MGLAARVLGLLGVALDDVRLQVIGIVGSGEPTTEGMIPFTAQAERALELSLDDALESPLAFPAHGRSIRQYRQALYDFEKERWRRGEADSHPFDRHIYPPENGKY